MALLELHLQYFFSVIQSIESMKEIAFPQVNP